MSHHLPLIKYLVAQNYISYLNFDERDSLSFELDEIASNIALNDLKSWAGLILAYLSLGIYCRFL